MLNPGRKFPHDFGRMHDRQRRDGFTVEYNRRRRHIGARRLGAFGRNDDVGVEARGVRQCGLRQAGGAGDCADANAAQPRVMKMHVKKCRTGVISVEYCRLSGRVSKTHRCGIIAPPQERGHCYPCIETPCQCVLQSRSLSAPAPRCSRQRAPQTKAEVARPGGKVPGAP